MQISIIHDNTSSQKCYIVEYAKICEYFIT